MWNTQPKSKKRRSLPVICRAGTLVSIFLLAAPAFATTVTVSSSTSWTAGANSGADVVVTGATLTLGAGSYNFNSLTVQSSGIVVGQGNTSAGTGVIIQTTADISVDSTSKINADAQGYTAATGTGSGTSGSGSNYGGGGGSYGGAGTLGSNANSAGATYGSGTQPNTLGSGGGNGASGSAGGAGGGALKLIVGGTLTINGTVSANGGTSAGASYGTGGGGSGGSVFLNVGTLAGTGAIQAKGGSAGTAGVSSYQGGAGGGGRIAVFYSTANNFTGTASVVGGTGYNSSTGTSGTYFEQNSATGDVSCTPTGTFGLSFLSPPYSINNFTVNSGCTWVIYDVSALTVPGNLTVNSGGTLNADSQGGGSGTASTTQPTYRPSGGGGMVKLVVTGTTTINGTLSSNGTVTNKAGGSVWIQTATLAGSGTIAATGNGTGSGGAIAVYYSTSSTYSGTVSLSSSGSGSVGSLFIQNSTTGDISCPFNITTYFNPTDSLPSYTVAINNVSITNGCKYGFKTGSTGTSATLTVAGDMTIDATPSYFYADGYGSGALAGTGHGTSNTGSYGGGGGGYGGAGANGYVGSSGGSTYGSATQPTDLGSGGGNQSGVGGNGGGAVKLVVTGTLTVNGVISANGAGGGNGGSYGAGGGGSGGSIWLQVGTLAGTGSIYAKGGNGGTSTGGSNAYGGGGGGGRIAVYYSSANNFTGTVSVAGGTGYATGTTGTYFEQNSATGDVTCTPSLSSFYDPSATLLYSINNFSVNNSCNWTVLNGTVTIGGNLTVSSSASFNVNNVGTSTGTASTTQPTLQNNGGGGALKLIVSGTSTVSGTLAASTTVTNKGGGSLWLQTASLAGAGTIAATGNGTGSGGAIAIYYSSATTFSGTVAVNSSGTGSVGSFFYQNSTTGDISCPFNITTYFNPADNLPSYTVAINNVSITNGCKYGFKSGATGTSATMTVAGNMTIDATPSYFYADGYGSGALAGTGHGTTNTGSYGGAGGGYGGAGANGYVGSTGGSTYGSATQPTDLGSGGGNGSGAGGTGGGAIKLIVTGTLTVNGVISSNGTAGGTSGMYAGGGGGSGGSIWLQVGTLAGTGSIYAKGGNGGTSTSGSNYYGGGGGGGRIAVYYSSANNFAGTVSVAGGTGYASGSVGTYYNSDASGNMSCTSATTTYYDPSSPPAGGIASLTISGGCNFYVTNGTLMTVTGNVSVASGSTLGTSGTGTLNSTNATTQPGTSNNLGALQLSVGGTLTVNGTLSGSNALWVKTATLAGSGVINSNATAIYYSTNSYTGTLTDTGSLFFQNYSTGDLSCSFANTVYFNPADALPSYTVSINNVSITNGCKYGFKSGSSGTSATLTVAGNMTIDATPSYFYADGYGSGAVAGTGHGTSNTGSYGGGGGGYGGAGAAGNVGSTGGSTYGSATQPTDMGSGGGNASGAGGAGGGAIKLIVSGTLTVNGTLSANGIAGGNSASYAGGGGGSGGSIWLQIGTLSGSGSILAKGGNGGTGSSSSYNGGGGGGGRIAIYYSSANNFTGTLSVAGGTGYASGSAGTYYNSDASGNMSCTSATTTYYDPSNPPSGGIASLTISGGCNFYVTNGSLMTVTGNVSIASGSTFGTSGTGTLSSTNATTQPTTSNNLGALQLSVGGTLTVNGTLSGTNALWVKAATLAGSGVISSNASAIYYSTNSYTGTLTDTGTLFFQNYSTGDLSCPFANTVYFNPADALPSYSVAINNVSITNGCKYGFKSGATGTSATLTATGNMTIDATPSYFYADGYGSGAVAGTGHGTTNTGSYGGGGGGYGGAGASGQSSGAGGSAYGSATQPTDLGSGGGNGYGNVAGGAGGGAIKLVIAGTLTVNGTLSANGNAGSNNASYAGGGGGSGGSIWLQVGTLAGAGSILAKGGNGGTGINGNAAGGGGGGGRIALYFTSKTFSGTVSAAGGTGYGTGTAGTISGLYPAGKLVFSTQPSSTGQVGVALAQQPVVEPLDSTYNTIDVNYTQNVTLTAYSNNTCTTAISGAVVNGSPQAIAYGMATFANVFLNTKNGGNPIYLQATSGTLTSACSTAITLSNGPASVLVFTTQPSASDRANVAFSTVPVVAAQDGYSDTVTTYSTAIVLTLYKDNTCSTAVATGTLSNGSVTPTSGVSTFTGIKYSQGSNGLTYYFKASSGTLTTACSTGFVIAGTVPMIFRGW